MAEYVYVPVSRDALDDNSVSGDVRVALAQNVRVIYSNLSLDAVKEGKAPVQKGHFLDKQAAGHGRYFMKANRPLSVVGGDVNDVLWLVAHGYGDRGVGQVNAEYCGLETKGHRSIAFRYDVMAERLKKDGLPTSFRNLRLALCYSAIKHGTRFGYKGPMVQPAGAESFGAKLARALGQLGYASIQVTGYQGEVISDSASVGRAYVRSHSFTVRRLSEVALTYNARGSVV